MYGDYDSRIVFATRANILASDRSTAPSGTASQQGQNARLLLVLTHKPVASVGDLSPVIFSAQDHLTSELLRTLSRVAASKPTSWLSR
jgi:hypothetical protein